LEVRPTALLPSSAWQAERGYSGRAQYCRSKLMNLLSTFELARRLEGSGVTVNALHPGWVATGHRLWQ
jgi:NAD(P)-dependent dehydrogenase (short-subunit alcohol dehydrogenase family)